MRKRVIPLLLACAGVVGLTAPPATAGSGVLPFEVESLDGGRNNLLRPDQGKAGTPYLRAAAARYADGVGAMVAGPNPRMVTNRIFNDSGQPLFSPRGVSQWAPAWGQFLDHTFALRMDGDENVSVIYPTGDPMERFTSAFPGVPVFRSVPAADTGQTTPRQQLNDRGSYLNAYAVYGDEPDRLEWMREGPLDGDLSNNSARLLMPNGFLPRTTARGDANAAPFMDRTVAVDVADLAVAGDFRGNENFGLLAVQTLFAKEHNRIVSLLPQNLSEEEKFQLARRVVIATQQYVTYNEFLPSLGVKLPAYRGYRPDVDATITNEFATIGYRAHSMVRGDFAADVPAGRFTEAQLAEFRAQGMTVTPQGRTVRIVVPPDQVVFNTPLFERIGTGPFLAGLAARPQFRNDEQIADVLRSLPIPVCRPGAPCENGIFDITSIDIQRGRDHGIANYNDLRRAYGLAPRADFKSITGERTDSFPADSELTAGDEINDPDSLDFLALRDVHGRTIPLDSPRAQDSATSGERRTPVAARLKAIYGDVSDVDPIVAMASEPLVPGTEFGELQLAMWTRQFTALRDGDRFHHLNDPVLTSIRHRYGIDYRHTVAELISLNTDTPRSSLPANVFKVR
ncbi:peroxidase family protein [Lentzea sp. JNUCC 0626]|uniref:peroxidase family protein n=1 Tax=Lentzea sp. JNUCC 0626 TaxID=3367513 RepID=UPI00374A88FC